MNLFKSIVIAAIALLPMTAAAYSVSGTVSDPQGAPEAYSTVRIFQLPDTIKTVSLGITNDEGSFLQELKTTGEYLLKISSVGRKPISTIFTISKDTPDVALGNLTMADNTETLGEVTVVATKPLVKKEIDRIGYDVQADEDSKTSNVQDILRKVPMVTVESDGTIKVKGSTNFKIYKDGRPSNSFTANAKDIFQAIPASMIERIEVITDPGAREDAEGVGAILNIVTVKNSSMNGIMGNVRAGMMTGNATPVGGIWLTGNVGKVVLSANAGYFHQSEKMSESNTETTQTFADSGNTRHSSSASKSKGNFTFYGIDGSYELDSLNLFTLEFGGHYYDFKSRDNSTTTMLSSLGSMLYTYDFNTLTPKNRGLNFNGNFAYQHSTRRKGETITLSYQISNSDTKTDTYTDYTPSLGFPYPYTSQSQLNDLNFLENTVQLDWTRPINEHNTFAVGGKFISRNNRAKVNSQYFNTNSPEDDEAGLTDFTHLTTIGAAYADYRLNYGAFSGRAGLRYEYSRLSAKYHDQTAEDFGSSLNDWVPNASVMYSFSQSSTLKFAYSSRINRPGISFLNPAVTITPTSMSSGNPELSSVHYNSLSLNYSLFTRKFSLDLNASYDFSNSGIAAVTWIDDEIGPDFLINSYDNIGRTRDFNMSVFAQWSVTTSTSLMMNAQVAYNHIKFRNENLSNHRWSTNLFFRASQMLPWRLRLEGMMFYGSGDLQNVYSYNSTGARGIFHGFSLQRSFLKGDALTVKLHARNPFNSKFMTRTYTDRGPYTGFTSMTMPSMRIFGVELSWRFGSVKASVKKAANGINNDDLQGGTSAPSTSQGGISM